MHRNGSFLHSINELVRSDDLVELRYQIIVYIIRNTGRASVMHQLQIFTLF